MTNKLKIKLKDILPSKEDLVKLKFLHQNELELLDVDEDGCEELIEKFYEDCKSVGYNPEVIYDLVMLVEAFKYIKEEWEVE